MSEDCKYTIDWSKGIINWNLPDDGDGTIFLATGDVFVAGEIEKIIKSKGDDFLFNPTSSIFQSADIVLGNLENPLSERGFPITKCGPNFRASPFLARTLAYAGFTALGVANNHSRDYGDQAFLDTLSHLKNAGVLSVGGGVNSSAAFKSIIVKSHDVSIGVLAFTYRQESIAANLRPGAADLDDPECYRALKALCDEVDVVIIYLHMGIEFTDYPSPHRIRMARRFIDLGAEMVIGHHPHVPQGIEIYKGKLIAYSLGNFLFDLNVPGMMTSTPNTKIGYMLTAKLTKKGTAWAKILPYRINNFMQPMPLSNTDYYQVMGHLERISEGILSPEIIQYMWEKAASKEVKTYLKYLFFSKHPLPFRLWSCWRPELRYCYRSWILSFIRKL